MDLENEDCPDGFWPVYKGGSFNLWTPDAGEPYAWADPEPVLKSLQSKRRGRAHSEFSAEYVQNPETLSCHQARIAFRDIARSTDQRTIISCLVPPNVFITNKGPYFLWPHGDKKDEAYLLGVLSSIPLDWYAQCFVELGVNFFIINSFPIPRPSRESVLWLRVVQLSGRLACPDERFAEWAEKVGVDYGPLTEDEHDDYIHELDAVVAHLYGLSELHLTHIFGSLVSRLYTLYFI